MPTSALQMSRRFVTLARARCRLLMLTQCFGTTDPAKFSDTSLESTWRLWIYQVCTQWGYFFVAPPAGVPSLVSRQHTLAYETQICRAAFPPGKHNVVPPLPNVTAVNALGDFGIAADRLAIIDGEVDPWKPATPHSRYAKDRKHTRLRPFMEIKGGVHHWDEVGSPFAVWRSGR
jgi:hypothetical protein